MRSKTLSACAESSCFWQLAWQRRFRPRSSAACIPRKFRHNLPPASPPLRLSVQDAEALALRNNPQVSVYRLLAMASQQVTREAKSNYYPNLYGSVTAVEPQPGSRIAAGALNNPIIYERVAAGVTLAQLITDFGRTNNLVATAALRAKASNLNAQATAAQIKLAVDQAFYNALQANAELKVAEQTVECSPTGQRPDHHPVQQQAQVATRCELRQRQLVAGEAAVAGCAEQLSGRAVGVVRDSRLLPRSRNLSWSSQTLN